MNYKEKLYSAYVKSGQARLSDFYWQKKDPYVEYVISNCITSKKDALIVDLGCGYGKYIYRLKTKGYTNIKGVDLAVEQVEAAHKAGIHEIEQGELLTFLRKQPNGIDVVLLMDIIEHLSLQEIFDLIDEVKKKLSETGKIILHVPNAEGIFGMRIRFGDL
ncbi:MAG: class I SAM-dependent methyltransferase, partial [Bacteroidia bacterium]|nr:class I SAM-dependent methyltransferase [Bacteroidia bacterium]